MLETCLLCYQNAFLWLIKKPYDALHFTAFALSSCKISVCTDKRRLRLMQVFCNYNYIQHIVLVYFHTSSVAGYRIAGKFNREFNLTFFALTVKLISVNVNFPYTMCLLTGHFVKFKIRHIFIMQFGGYFVKFYSRQIFRPYGS